MPIALPAPLPPVQGAADIIKTQGAAIVTASVKDTQVHVIGPDVVNKATLEGVLANAVDLSDAVRQIQAVYYTAGYPAVKVTYGLAQPDLFVLVSLNKVSAVEVPAPYDAYFSGLPSADPLTDADLEPARTMASLHADRAGQIAVPVFKADAENTVLRIEPTDGGPGRSTMGLSFGNPGNRFVGRHFLDYFAGHGFTTGDELRATGRHATTGVNNDDEAESYYEHTLSWSKVTPLGLFGVTGRNVGYQQPISLVVGADPVSFDGKIRQGEVSWLYLLAADFDSRLAVGAKLDYTYKNFDVTLTDELIQRQEYGSAELSAEYTRAVRPMDVRTDLNAGLAVRSGLGSDETDNAIRAADFGYLLFRPSLGLRAGVGQALVASLRINGQYSGDTVPEQQQWVMGGVGNMEAYLPGVATGDSGGLARLQLEATVLDLGSFKLVPRVFAEYGFTRLENPFLGQPDGTQSLADAGVALGIAFGKYLEASVSYAESFEEDGIDEAVLENADANMFFQVGAKF